MRKNLGIYRVKNTIQAIAEPHECCLLLPRRKLGLKMSQILKKKKEGWKSCKLWLVSRLFRGATDCSLYSGLRSERGKKGEHRRRRVKKRGGGTGQLQCGQVCRVSRERERFGMKHYGIDWFQYWWTEWLIEMRCGLTCVRSGLSPWSIPTRCVTKKEGGGRGEGLGKEEEVKWNQK